MIVTGKLVMSPFSVMVAISPRFSAVDNLLWLWILAAVLLGFHGLQWLAMRKVLQHHNQLRSTEKWQFLLFGFFALWQFRKRLPTA